MRVRCRFVETIDEEMLHEIFQKFDTVITKTVAFRCYGRSRFVMVDNDYTAKTALF
jgi:hypothetical protein